MSMLLAAIAMPAMLFLQAHSQAPADSGPSARQMAESWVQARGWSLGWDQAARQMVVISEATFGDWESEPGLFARRAEAFAEAGIDAKRQVIGFLAAEVATAARSNAEAVAVFGSPKVAARLAGLAAEEAYSEQSDFERVASVAAQAMISAVVPIQSFVSRNSNGGQVALVYVWGPRTLEAISGEMAAAEPGMSLGSWFESLEDNELICSWGGRLRVDRGGRWRVVAFGVAAARDGLEDHAFEEAELDAIRHLRTAVGEQAASESESLVFMSISERSEAPPVLESQNRYASSIRRQAEQASVEVSRIGRRLVNLDSGGSVAVVALAIAAEEAESARGTSVDAEGCPDVEPRMQPFVRQVQARGNGPTESEATIAALKEAVRMDGVQVRNDARLARRFDEVFDSIDGEMREKVRASTSSESTTRVFSNGFVHSYLVLDRKPSPGGFEVSICANLVRFDPADPRFGLPPTVAVLPWTSTAASVEIEGRAAPGARIAKEAEGALERTLLRSGRFQVLDERGEPLLSEYRENIQRRAESGKIDERELIKLGRALSADFVLTGAIERVLVIDRSAANPSERLVEVVLDARLVNVADGRIAWSDSARIVLDGRELAQARAGRTRDGKPLADPSDFKLSPIDLGVRRAWSALAQSLQEHLATR